MTSLTYRKITGILCIGSSGIHIGQSDCTFPEACRLVGPDAIIGVSVGNATEARQAVKDGADYVGIGPVWHTTSKDLKGKPGLGPDGVGEILEELSGTMVQAVAIGKWNARPELKVRRDTSAKPPSAFTWLRLAE